MISESSSPEGNQRHAGLPTSADFSPPVDPGPLPGGNAKLRGPATDALFQAVLALRTVDECYAFFEDLLTTAELHSIAQRWQVAGLLDQGQKYEDVASVTHASSATISRVSRSLHYGADGYRLILDRLADHRHE